MPNPIALLNQIRWRKLATKTATVVAAEMLLNAAGLDTIANYAEFINEHRTTIMEVVATVITTCS
jgi:antirestriction protein